MYMQKKLETKDIPNHKKVLKPWGSEYKIYSNSILSIKLLRIHKNQSTSLHCHPVKKTGFILIKGTVEVDLGFYNKKNLSAPTKLMIRPGLFHATKNNINETSVILEIETPIDKDDLVRFKDSYGRENKSYEGKKYLEELSKDDLIFDEPKVNQIKKYNLENMIVTIEKTNNIKNLKNRNKKAIFAILDGGLKSNNNLLVLSPGDIVGSDTLNKLCEVFKIHKYITILSVV